MVLARESLSGTSKSVHLSGFSDSLQSSEDVPSPQSKILKSYPNSDHCQIILGPGIESKKAFVILSLSIEVLNSLVS